METKKILKSKIKKNTILSVFDNVQDKPITLLKWIKSIYKNCKIERIEVQESNTKNEFGIILIFHFLDESYLQTPLIKVATESVIEEITQAIDNLNNEITNLNERVDNLGDRLVHDEQLLDETTDKLDDEIEDRENADTQLQENINNETNARELADSELQHDIDNHTNNNTIHVTQQDKDNWNTGRSPLYLHTLSISNDENKEIFMYIINSSNQLINTFALFSENINKMVTPHYYFDSTNTYYLVSVQLVGQSGIITIDYINNNQVSRGSMFASTITSMTDTVTAL